MAETIIRPADEPRELARDLIDAHHPHLNEARILWLMTSAKRTSKNRVVLGTSNRATVVMRYMSARDPEMQGQPADFIVLIEAERWQRLLLTQKRALVDNLLCRMQQRETTNKRSGKVTKTFTTVGPEVEAFVAEIKRHGVWLPEHQAFARAVQQHGGQQLTLEIPDPRLEADDDDQADDEDESEPAPAPVAEAGSNGVDHSAAEGGGDWKAATGIGSSPAEVRRARRRGTASSEQPAEGAPA